jgi:putative oxidoreductase
MSLFQTPSRRQIDAALAVLRVVLGATFILHGGQKLFVYGLDGVTGSFAQMGIPAAAFVGPLVAFVEFFGGIAIVLGLLTRVAALGVGATMAGAILTVHLKQGFFNPGGVEFPLALLASAVALVLTGAGAYSADAAIAKRIGQESEAGVTPEAVQGRARRAA